MWQDTITANQGVRVALIRTAIATFLTSSVLVLSGCAQPAASCAPDAEHEHAQGEAKEEEEECAPGTNCMCTNGMLGTKVCDVKTKAFVECNCMGAAGMSAAAPTGTTASAVTGAAGMTAAATTAAAGMGAMTTGAAGMSAAATTAAAGMGAMTTGAAGMAAATTTSSAAGTSAAGAAASSNAGAGGR
jgi:hypothetical protein